MEKSHPFIRFANFSNVRGYLIPDFSPFSEECEQEDNPRQALLSKSITPDAATNNPMPPQNSSYGSTTPTSVTARSPTSQREADVTALQPGINDAVVQMDDSRIEEA